MDIKDLFLSCKRGDFARVQYLVEQTEVELNVKDRWDSTPLYYACLCGHEEIVTYLLEMGARCEINTFEGERCMYGALNNHIRNMLKNYKQLTSSTKRRNVYTEFLRKLLDRGMYTDLTFIVHGEHFPVHRCILVVRSKYFSELLQTKWAGKDVVHLTHKLIIPRAFRLLLNWLYTGQVEVHFDDVEDVIRLARQCQLDTLMEDLEDKLKQNISFEMNKPGVRVTVINLENAPNLMDLKDDFAVLSNLALPEIQEFPFQPEAIHTYPDITFSVEGVSFHCHKAFFMCRSDYFKALEEDHFGEYSINQCDDCDLHAITISGISTGVFAQVLNYIYTDTCELNEKNVYEILCAGDMYLLPGLKRYCAGMISKYIELENVINVLQTARLFNLAKLEDDCALFMSKHIEKLVQSQEFADLVTTDAETVKGREETDSIPIIDDIRYHVSNSVQDFSDIYETDQKMRVIDDFLETLNLDA